MRARRAMRSMPGNGGSIIMGYVPGYLSDSASGSGEIAAVRMREEMTTGSTLWASPAHAQDGKDKYHCRPRFDRLFRFVLIRQLPYLHCHSLSFSSNFSVKQPPQCASLLPPSLRRCCYPLAQLRLPWPRVSSRSNARNLPSSPTQERPRVLSRPSRTVSSIGVHPALRAPSITDDPP